MSRVSKPLSRSKLARQAAIYYADAGSQLKQTTAKPVHAEQIVNLKTQLYTAIAEYQFGLHLVEQKEFGEAIASKRVHKFDKKT